MTIQEIKEMIQVVVESGVAELEVQRGENRVRIRRTAPANSEVIVPTVATPVLTAAPIAAPVPLPTPVAAPAGINAAQGLALAAAPAADPALATVKSPIVGTFYESPSPDSPPFVRVGDLVRPGQVLCIIESMKLMNEIESEVSGTIASKLVENGHPVEYGEALFLVRPA